MKDGEPLNDLLWLRETWKWTERKRFEWDPIKATKPVESTPTVSLPNSSKTSSNLSKSNTSEDPSSLLKSELESELSLPDSGELKGGTTSLRRTSERGVEWDWFATFLFFSPACDLEVHLLQKHDLDVNDGVHWVWLTVLARRRPVFLFPFLAGKASPSFPWLSVC